MDKINSTSLDSGHLLFLNPPSGQKLYRGIVCNWLSKATYVWKPFDFILLSAWVPSSFRISYIDSFIHKTTLENICAFIERERVSALVMSMSSIVWGRDLETLRALRSRFPGLRIAVLGDIFQEREFVEQALPFEVTIIRHPFDPALSEYFKTGQSTSSSLLQNFDLPSPELPPVSVISPVDLPLPRHEVFLNRRQRSPFDKYRNSTIVNTNWSCPFECSYCSYSSPYLPFAYRSAESVLRELATLQKLKVREIFFGDATFGTPRSLGREILRAMERSELRFSWHCYLTPKNIPHDFLEKMASCGCHTVIIGVESSHPETLAKFNRDISTSEISTFVRDCHRLGIAVCGDFILGLNDSPDDWKLMTDFAIGLKLDYASFNIYIPMLGSQERRKAIKAGQIQGGDWGYDTTAYQRSMVKHAENRLLCVRRFFGRPGYWWKRLIKLRTFDEVVIKLEEFLHLVIIKR